MEKFQVPGERSAWRKAGRCVIVSTFGPEGPTKCSGLEVMCYDAEALHRELGRRFRVEGSSEELQRAAVRVLLLQSRVTTRIHIWNPSKAKKSAI
jgi:hypothetical protein